MRATGQTHATESQTAAAGPAAVERVAVDLNLALDRVPTPFAMVGMDGLFTDVNRAFAALLGYERDELRGTSWARIVDPADAAQCSDYMAAALDGGPDRASLQVRFIRADGEQVASILGAAMICDDDGDPCGFVGHVQDVTEQLRAQAALTESEERHRVLFQRLPVALYRTSPAGEILESNEALAELLGYPNVASLKGLNASDAYAEEGERSRVARQMEEHGMIEGHESELRRRDGSIVWVRDTARVVHDGASTFYEGALVDVTDRRRAELELFTRARQQEALASLGHLALESSDLDQLFDAAVASLSDVFGTDHSGILSLQEDGAFFHRASTAPVPIGEVASPAGNRSLAWFTVECSEPVIVDDLATDDRFAPPREQTNRGLRSAISAKIPTALGIFGVIGSFSTELGAFGPESRSFIQSVANVLAAAIERTSARRRLEELVRSKDEFIASVSHEVRTPLTVVSGLAQELADRWPDLAAAEVDEFVGLIVEHSRDMTYLIDDLLVAARADIGKVPIHPETVELREIATQALAGLSSPAEATVAIGDDETAAYADRGRVRQIVRNLLTNAYRYGGRHIEVRCGAGDDQVWLEVEDDGVGIPEAEVDRIFDPYHGAHHTAGQPSSVGLGLTVSRKLARLMGGDLTYRNGSSTVFRVTLPPG